LYHFLPLMLTLALGGTSCHKSSETQYVVTVNVVNAMATANPIAPFFGEGPAHYANYPAIGYQSAGLFSPLSGTVPVSVVPMTDTTFHIFSGSLTFQPNGIYSFFLAGDTTKPDTVLTFDKIPVYNDSSSGVRFINLSPGSQALSVTLAGNPASRTEFSGLTYKKISGFNKYLADSSIPGDYMFVIRDEATGDSLTSFDWSYALQKNHTLVIAGSTDPASPTALSVFQMQNY